MLDRGVYRISNMQIVGTDKFGPRGQGYMLRQESGSNEADVRGHIPAWSHEPKDVFQYWSVIPLAGNHVRIRHALWDKYIDLEKGKENWGIKTCISQAGTANEAHQVWEMIERSDDKYSLRSNAFPSYYLDHAFDGIVKAYTDADSDHRSHQEFSFERVHTISLRFMSYFLSPFTTGTPMKVQPWSPYYLPVSADTVFAAYDRAKAPSSKTVPYWPREARPGQYEGIDFAWQMRRALAAELLSHPIPDYHAPAFGVAGARDGKGLTFFFDEDFLFHAFDPMRGEIIEPGTPLGLEASFIVL